MTSDAPGPDGTTPGLPPDPSEDVDGGALTERLGGAGRRPGALLAIGVVAVALGLFGACGAVLGLAGFAIQGAQLEQQESFLRGSGVPAEEVERQMALSRRMVEITESLQLPLTLSALASLAVSVWLLVAAIQVLRRLPSAVGLFTAAAIGRLLVGAGGLALQGVYQMRTRSVLDDVIASAAAPDGPQGPPGGGAAVEAMMQAFTRGAIVLAIVFGVLWWLGELGFFLWSIRALRRMRRPST